MGTSNSHVGNAFEIAKNEFMTSQNGCSLFDRVADVTTVHDIYEFVMQFQSQQSNTTGMRSLRRINDFLEGLRQYSQVVEQFVQVKPDVLALIWGPIKLLLQMANVTLQSFNAIVNAMVNIGNCLPLFETFAMLFRHNDRVKDALVLFYKDILDFFSIALNFLSLKRETITSLKTRELTTIDWKFVFDSVWPKHSSKIDVVVSNIKHHSLLLRDEVNLEHISEAHRARELDFDRWAQNFEFQARQNFSELRTFISPKMYDDDQDRFQSSMCERTGCWIQKDKIMRKWFNSNDTSNRLIWLQGIPGAGKTYVCSNIVARVKSLKTPVLFVFLSYKQGNISTISIFHSLIFQLVIGWEGSDNALREDMRIKLFETYRSSQRNLKSNTKFARETLCSLLHCVGPVHIVIDGLDELEEHQRDMTLREILNVSQDAPKTKILISSRMEDDISRVMKKTGHKSLRVDDNNRGCIQAFVSSTSQKWLSDSDLDEDTGSEIMSLLSLLAAKAKGMFLYAKIVMENIRMCQNPESIRDELRALPDSLQDAYARILQRLHRLQPATRDMSRRALGWIGCSATPISLQELSFALNMADEKDLLIPRNTGTLNIVRLCGPIVEISGDYVHFVHFTVKDFVSTLEANVDMASTCLRYLCLDIFDTDIDSVDVKEHILSGRYGLFWFAASQLLNLLQKCARLLCDQPLPESLTKELALFCQTRENVSFAPAAVLERKAALPTPPEDDDFEIFKRTLPEEHRFLHHALALRRLDDGQWRLDQDDEWIVNDPSTLSEITTIIHEQFEALLCKASDHSVNCACVKIKYYYGSRLFRCHYAICQPQRIAFEQFSSRETHCKNHARSYKCPHTQCAFYTLGFSSQRQLDRHTEKCHRDTQPRWIQVLPNPDSNELVPLLSDLISLGRTAEVEALCKRFQSLAPDSQRTLLNQAAHSGPLQMVKALYLARDESPSSNSIPFADCKESEYICRMAHSSLSGENVEVLEWLSLKTSNVCKGKCGFLVNRHFSTDFFTEGVNSDSDEMFEAWKKYFTVAIRTGTRDEIPQVMQIYFIRTITDPVKQERLAGIWDEIIRWIKLPQDDLGDMLSSIAATTCSVALAKVLLEAGVDVDFRQPEMGKEVSKSMTKTPLHLASRKMTRAAAEMMKLLLLWGANPKAEARTRWSHAQERRSRDKAARPRRTIGMERGTRNIEKWLGISWENLVEWAQEQRLQNIKQDGNVVTRMEIAEDKAAPRREEKEERGTGSEHDPYIITS